MQLSQFSLFLLPRGLLINADAVVTRWMPPRGKLAELQA
jgi:hypothetical protein